ncbi:hypothetical protein ES705_18406 [subsurface metagenome]
MASFSVAKSGSWLKKFLTKMKLPTLYQGSYNSRVLGNQKIKLYDIICH